jgi:hypothetical protein
MNGLDPTLEIDLPEDWLAFNGLNPVTGEYLVSPLSLETLRDRLAGVEVSDLGSQEGLAALESQAGEKLPLPPGIDPQALDQAGWAILFPASFELRQVDAILEALSELIDLRMEQVGSRFRIYHGTTECPGIEAGESAEGFHLRLGGQPGSPDLDILPYYLLLVAPPDQVSFQFQNELSLQRSVGRLWFEDLASYALYARGVARCETLPANSLLSSSSVSRQNSIGACPWSSTFFSPANPKDRPTALSAARLVDPLQAYLEKNLAGKGWHFEKIVPGDATRSRLQSILNEGPTPSLLFSASHGLGLPSNDPTQRLLQGALVCQDWPGPLSGPIERCMVFAGEDLETRADLTGLVAFFFACFSAGTPEMDEFAGARSSERGQLAPSPFLSDLPVRMLGQPGGAALAVIGHVERACGYSYYWKGFQQPVQPGNPARRVQPAGEPRTFQYALHELMLGSRLGYAFSHLTQRYAELATLLAADLAELKFNPLYDAEKTALHWIGAHDARGYAILGDPAIRLIGN